MTTATQTPAPTPAGEGSVGAGQPRVFDARDRAMLELERLRFHSSAGKEAEILSRFSMTPATYYVRLNWILNQPEAAEYDAQLVDRLVRLREKRRLVRTVGSIAAGVETRNDLRGVRPALGGVL